ncbi:unnamed protein product [Camellia sinensis]
MNTSRILGLYLDSLCLSSWLQKCMSIYSISWVHFFHFVLFFSFCEKCGLFFTAYFPPFNSNYIEVVIGTAVVEVSSVCSQDFTPQFLCLKDRYWC